MSRLTLGLLFVALAACSSGGTMAEFWRPISEPNLLMPLDRAQAKLDFDLSQCNCGIFPKNAPHSDLVAFQPDQQRLAQTSITITADRDGDCMQRPSLVVAECMRSRGWEITKCTGRMPLAGGGAVCAGAMLDDGS
jgi:hypothetical protein